MQGLFEPLFQPIVDATGAVYAYEALMRFHGHDASPAPFVLRWEKTGFIKHADRAMLKRIAEIVGTARPALRLAVNVSIATVEEGGTAYLEALKMLTPHTRRVIVELTETSPIQDMPALMRFIGHCRELGCSIAMDDCRPGHLYGDPAFIAQIKPQAIKLDGEFLHHCYSTREIAPAVELLAAARSVSATVIAECVDSPAIRDFAFWLGVNLAQGHAIGRPAPLPGIAKPAADTMPAPLGN